MRTEKFKDLFDFAKKSKIKAGDGQLTGSYPFYTSSSKLSKRIDKWQIEEQALIFGTGGKASVHFADERFSTSTDCIVAKRKKSSDLNVKFVYYYLFGNIHILERGFKGAGLKHISKKYIQNIDLPIYDIETQNKIVAVLDKASRLLQKREESIQLLDELLRAQFLEMFELSLKNIPKDGIKLSDISTVVSGITKGRKTKETKFIRAPYLRVANAQDGYFNLEEIKFIQATEKEIERYRLNKYDILITEGGDPDKLGRGAVWNKEESDMIYQNHLYRIRISNLENYSSYWLSYLLSSAFGKRYFLRQAKQTTGIATINKRQVSAFPIPECQYPDQKKFENIYHSVKNRIGILLKSQKQLHNLFNSLLQRAFNGQLNFIDETALNTLLDAIDVESDTNDLRDITFVYLRQLIEKLNDQDFEDMEQYQKAKHAAFQLLREGKLTQTYQEDSKSVNLQIV